MKTLYTQTRFRNDTTFLDSLAASLKKLADASTPTYSNYEQVQFMRSVSQVTGLDIGDVFLLNVQYEIGNMGCLGILAVDQDGTLLHGRNLDFYMFNHISNITAHLDFYRNGTLQYSSL
jgi:hypothetical protein